MHAQRAPQGPGNRFECGRSLLLGLCGFKNSGGRDTTINPGVMPKATGQCRSKPGRPSGHVLCLLLLLCGQARADDFVIGGQLSKAQIEELRKQAASGDKAKQALDALASREVRLDAGVFFPFKYGQGNQLWLWSDESICKRLDVPAGQKFALWGRVGDEKEATLHVFEPSQELRGWLLGAKEGRTEVTVISNGENGGPPIVLDRLTVIVGKPQPTPPGPTPPGPTPPGPVPIPDTGFRVLIVTETADLSELPAAQVAAINAREVREYLNAKCAKVNGHPEWRVYDQHTNVTRESKIWQDAMKRPRASIPWILISDGKTGYEGALPANKDELLKLLKQYGGQ